MQARIPRSAVRLVQYLMDHNFHSQLMCRGLVRPEHKGARAIDRCFPKGTFETLGSMGHKMLRQSASPHRHAHRASGSEWWQCQRIDFISFNRNVSFDP